MLVTRLTREVLRIRRDRRALFAAGYVEIGESGSVLWMFCRGAWMDQQIADVKIGPDKTTLFIRIEPRPHV